MTPAVDILLPGEARERSSVAAVWLLPFVLGLPAWLGVNAVFSELFFLIPNVPESYHIASQLTVVVQLGNIGPLAVGLFVIALRRFCPRWRCRCTSLALANGSILLLGFLSLLGLALFWNWRSPCAHADCDEWSSGLLLFALAVATADCLSNLTFWSYAGRLGPKAVTMLAAGETMSSVVCSVVVWCQKASGFGATAYFGILAGISGFCGTLFAVIHAHQVAGLRLGAGHEQEPLQTSEEVAAKRKVCRDSGTWVLCVQICWLSFVQNGLWFAVMPYTTSQNFFWLNTTLPQFLGPLASIAALFVLKPWVRVVAAATWNITAAIMVTVAALKRPISSPGMAGCFSAICVLGFLGIVYDKAALLTVAGRDADETSQRRMAWAGAAMQVGAALGSFTFYMIINVAGAFD